LILNDCFFISEGKALTKLVTALGSAKDKLESEMKEKEEWMKQVKEYQNLVNIFQKKELLLSYQYVHVIMKKKVIFVFR